jgi:phage terminase Nu1 subunit (DNA packaging protein)
LRQKGDIGGVSTKRLAQVFGVDERQVYRWAKDGLPRPKDLRADGYSIDACVQWRRKRDHDESAAKLEALRDTISDDPLLSGGGKSAALERYRASRADFSELQVQKERGNLINRSLVHDGFGVIFGQLRAASQRLRDRHGVKAGKVLDDCFRQMEREIRARFGAAPETEEE